MYALLDCACTLVGYDDIEFSNHVKFIYVILFHLIMFNYKLWTNPPWLFSWPPTLFVWMGRRRAWIVCFSLVSCWRLTLELPRFAFGVIRVGLSFRDVCLFILLWIVEIFIHSVCWVETYIWWCSVILWHGYLDIFYLSDEIIILFCCDVLRKLFMHVELIEEVTSRSLNDLYYSRNLFALRI